MKSSIIITLILSTLTCVLSPTRVQATPYGKYNQGHLDWQVTQTKYFQFYSTAESQNTLAYLTQIADDTFERLNTFYGWEPEDKIKVTILGYTSYANGFAEYSKERITIFPTAPDFHNRSRKPWLEGVFTHELSHIISLNVSTHWLSQMPLFLMNGLVRAGDHAQMSFKFPLFGPNHPHWYKEGIAQFDTWLLGRDDYDENRRAYQRASIEDDTFYSMAKLAFFGGEKWYNTGFGFLIYLEKRFGAGTVHQVAKELGESYYFVFENVFQKVTGVAFEKLEQDFRTHAQASYTAHRMSTEEGAYDGLPLRLEKQEIAYAQLSADEKEYQGKNYRITPLQHVGGKLYFKRFGAVHHADFNAETLELTNIKRIGAAKSFGPRTGASYFVLKNEESSPSLVPSFHRQKFESASIFVVDEEGEETLLLSESRLMDMDTCPARQEIAGIYNDGDASLKLALIPVEGFTETNHQKIDIKREAITFPLTARPLDEVRNPRYSPDCKRLYYSRRIGDDHDIYYYDFQTSQEVAVSTEESFELYPEPTDSGVYYVSARDGSMNIYYQENGKPAVNLSQAITSHHHIVHTPTGLLFGRFYSTGLQTHFLSHEAAAGEPVRSTNPKEEAPPLTLQAAPEDAEPYTGLLEWVPPTFVPIISWELDTSRAGAQSLRLQGGLEFTMQDQLKQHWLLVRAFAGNRSNIHASYWNRTLPVSLSVWGGISKIKSLYTWGNNDSVYDRMSTYHWGYMGALAELPLNLFYDIRFSASTIRDTGTIYGAGELPVTWLKPRFGRDLIGLTLEYAGIDQSSPLYSPRTINRQGYRKFELELYFGQEYINPWLGQFNPNLPVGNSPFFRGEFNYTEYITLPKLAHGFFDHTLQIDFQLGYISRDVRFLPFIGGGRLYSMTLPELNTSVGFVGYRYFSLRGETALNLGLTYRFPIMRKISKDVGNIFIEDIYGQVFTSWGNIWGYNDDGTRQVPFKDKASNGQHILGDIGFDLRINHFTGELNGNFGTTIRTAYRIMPFLDCSADDQDDDGLCPVADGKRAVSFYLMFGGGF